MEVQIFQDKNSLGRAAAARGAAYIREALEKNGRANIIVATGASQFEMLSALTKEPGIDWSKVNIFHLDEYIGLPEDHPAGFRKYIRERFIAHLPVKPASFHPVNGSDPDPERVCAELGKEIAACPMAVESIPCSTVEVLTSSPRTVRMKLSTRPGSAPACPPETSGIS